MERNRSVEHLMGKLKITREEALELIEFDKTTHKPEAKPKPSVKASEKRTVKRPASNSKEEFINAMVALVEGNPAMLDAQQLKSNSITFKDSSGNYYTLALTAHKASPAGYQG